MDFLYLSAGSPKVHRLLSLGCGTGHLDRVIRRHGVADEVVAIDASSVSIDIAKRKAEEQQILGLRYFVADLDELSLRGQCYDAVVFHESLHHVFAVEKLLAEVRRALLPNGLLFLEEWVGPSRTRWTDQRLAPLRKLFHEIPERWRMWRELRPPIEEADPTEAARSSAIVPALGRLFQPLVDRPYGGQIVSVLLPQVDRTVIPEASLDDLIARWLAIEENDLKRDSESGFYRAMLLVPRSGRPSLAGRTVNAMKAVGLIGTRRS